MLFYAEKTGTVFLTYFMFCDRIVLVLFGGVFMKKLKKLLLIFFAVLFTVGSNGAYMYFKFFSGGETQAVAETVQSTPTASPTASTEASLPPSASPEVSASASPSIAVSASPAAEKESSIFANDTFDKLTFDYPKAWNKKINGDRAFYYAAENTFLMFGKSETKQNLDDSYFDSIIEGFKKSQKNFLEISRDRAQNRNGVKYYAAKYNQTINKENYLCSLVVIKVDSTLYMIGFTQPVSNSTNYSDDFSRVIESIKIKK